MSEPVVSPTVRRLFDDLARRVGILERRIRPDSTIAGKTKTHTHNGTGDDSVVLFNSADTDTVAGGASSLAAGLAAVASGAGTVAIGNGATASADNAVALGAAEAIADDSMALGFGAGAAHAHSSAIGAQASTTHTHQIILGDATDFVEIPGNGIVLTSPDSTRYRIVVNNGGSISTSPA